MKKSLKTTPQEILEGPILLTLIRLAIPTIIAFIFHTGFNFVDRFFVSRLGEIQFGALGMAFSVQMTVIAIGSGLGIGSSSLIARYIGAKKYDQANRAADQVLLLILVCSGVTTFGGLWILKPLFRLLGASEQMRPYILEYLQVILIGALFQFFSMLGNGVLRGEGNTVTPMRAMITGTLVNILLDPLCIFGLGPFPALGVRGAAIATVVARITSCLVIIHAFLSQTNIVKPTYRFYQVELKLLRGIFAVGGPAVVGNLVHPIGMSLLFFLLKPYGDASKAALTMGLTYQQVAILPIIGIGAATLTMAGQNYGAEHFQRIRTLNVKAVLFTISVLSSVTLLFILFSEPFAHVFSDSVDVITIGRTLLIITSLGFPTIGMRLIYASLFQGLGMGVKALILNMGQLVFFSFPLAWLLSQWFGLIGIWWGMTAGVFITAAIGCFWISITLNTLNTEGGR